MNQLRPAVGCAAIPPASHPAGALWLLLGLLPVGRPSALAACRRADHEPPCLPTPVPCLPPAACRLLPALPLTLAACRLLPACLACGAPWLVASLAWPAGEQMSLRFGVATLEYQRPTLPRRYTVVGPPRQIAGYADAELAEGLALWTTAVLCRSVCWLLR